MNNNRLAGFFGLSKKEFAISLAVGGLIVLTALLVEGYITLRSDGGPPTAASAATLAAPSTQGSSTTADVPPPGTAAPLARSLPTLITSSGRLVIAGGVIAGPATEGAFMQAAATARPNIDLPVGQAGALASSDATGTAKAAASPTGTAMVSPGLSTAVLPPPSSPLGSIFDPVPLGTAFTLPDQGVLTIQSTSWLPGQTGLAIANLSFSCQRTSPETCATSNLILAAVGNSGTTYGRTYDPAVPQPTFGSFALPHLQAGETDQGNAGFVITNAESRLTLRVRVFLQDGDYYFWLGRTP